MSEASTYSHSTSDVIKIWELRSKAVFEDELSGLYALTPLMPDANLDECLEKLMWAVEHNLISASSYMCMATFARLKYSKEVVNDFFTKNRAKTALRVGSSDIPS